MPPAASVRSGSRPPRDLHEQVREAPTREKPTRDGRSGGPRTRTEPPADPTGSRPAARRPVVDAVPDAEPSASPRGAVRAAARDRRRAEAVELRRFTRRSRRLRGTVAAVVSIAVLLIAVPVLLAVTPVFAVRTIDVQGATPEVASAVRAGLAGQLGEPVALVPESAVARAIAAVPAVERFTVVRLPPGTLQIRVALRTPVAQVRAGGGYALVDAARVAVQSSATRFPGVPLASVTGTGSTGDAAFRAAASAITAVHGVPGITVRRVSATTADDVQLVLTGGRRVVWGGADHPAAKAEALRAALVRAVRGTTVVDVSSPGVVTTR